MKIQHCDARNQAAFCFWLALLSQHGRSVLNQYSGILGQIGLGITELFSGSSDEGTKYNIAQTIFPYGLVAMGLGAGARNPRRIA